MEAILARVGIWWRRLLRMTSKELLQLLRDVVLLLFMVYAFTLDIYLSGVGVSLQLNDAPVAVLDQDRSLSSRELLSRFRPPAFALGPEVHTLSEGLQLLDQGEARTVLAIPQDFHADILEGRQTQVQLLVDTSNPVLGNFAASHTRRIVSEFGREILERRPGMAQLLQSAPKLENRYRVWFNPNQKDSWFMALTELLNIVTLFAILLPAMALVREKERGTIEQLLVTPLTPFQIMFPKILAMGLVILVGNALCLFGVLMPVFDLPVRGSIPLYFAVTAVYVFSMSGLGMLIATLVKNLGQAGLLTILVFGPVIFLSGSWTPPEAMPGPMRAAMHLSPLFHHLNASFGILLKGAGLRLIWDSVAAIGGLGLALFGLGMWRLRRQFH